MLHSDGVVRYAGPPSLVKGGTIVKRIPTIVWKEACEFSKTRNITPAQALLMIWEQKKAQDLPEHLEKNSVNLSVIRFEKIEPPAEKSFSAYETIQAVKVIEDTMDLCINPMIVLSLKNPDNGEDYKLIDGELQYLAYEKLGIKKVNVFILESEKELRNYQNQIQLFRNQRNGSKMKALEAKLEKALNDSQAANLTKLKELQEVQELQDQLDKRDNEDLARINELGEINGNLQSQLNDLRNEKENLQSEAQQQIDGLIKQLNIEKEENQRIAREFSDLKAKQVTSQNQQVKTTERNAKVIEGNYVKIDKSVIEKYQEIAQKAKPGSSRVEKLREFLQAVGFKWKKDEGRNWEYEG